MSFNPIQGIVHNEGCDLHYWYQGTGPLVTFIPGGNGHGKQYNKIMVALSDRFTCVTFDRRQMSASKAVVNKPLNPPQQARDILAIIKAVGFERSIIFGNSLGGVLAFQFAHDHPSAVAQLIVHEAPTLLLLPDASDVYEWLVHLMELKDADGCEAAAAEFVTRFVGYDAEGVPATAPLEPENLRNFWENEFYVISTYTPNLWRIRENGTKVGLMRGVRSGDAFYARTTYEQEKILGCPRMDVPGHHQGYEVETEEFLPYFFDMLKLLGWSSSD